MLLAWLAAAVLPAGAAEWRAGLAARQILQWQRWPTALVEGTAVPEQVSRLFQSLVRVTAEARLGAVRFQAAVENQGRYRSFGEGAGAAEGWTTAGGQGGRPAWWAWERIHAARDRRELVSSIERLDLSWTTHGLAVDLGRQPISLGTSHFLGVLDVVAPFHPGYLDASYKPGVDALRLRRGHGTAGEAELIAVADRGGGREAVLGRWRENVRGFDIELLGGRFRRRGFAGVAFDGEIRRLTWWGEAGCFARDAGREPWRHGARGGPAVSWITGVERNFGPRLRIGAAWFHQDFGTSDPAAAAAVARDGPFAEGWAFLTGTRYGLVTVHREFTPLIMGDLSGILSANDGSRLWQPKLTVSLGDNSDLCLFAWIRTGRSPVLVGGLPAPRSEFGAAPEGAGLLLRWFH